MRCAEHHAGLQFGIAQGGLGRPGLVTLDTYTGLRASCNDE